MCFKLNTHEGSLRMLGNGKACNLPNIPGRGIWQLGIHEMELQAPWMDTDTLKKEIKTLAEEFRTGERKMSREMIKEEPKELKEGAKDPKDSGKKETEEGAKDPDNSTEKEGEYDEI